VGNWVASTEDYAATTLFVVSTAAAAVVVVIGVVNNRSHGVSSIAVRVQWKAVLRHFELLDR